MDFDDYDDLAREVEELQKQNAEMRQELAGLYQFKRGVDEALNSGDGVYRP